MILNALIDFSDGARAGIIAEKEVRSWHKSQTDDTGDFAVQNVLKAFQDKIITDKFFSVRVRDCVKSLGISHVSANTKRGGHRINLSEKYRNYIRSLQQMNKQFLFTDPEIQASDNQGAFIMRTLFDIFRTHYVEKNSNTLFQNHIIPEDWHARLQKADESMKFRIICDYLSGMTDDYAKMTFDRSIAVAL
jgi:dGTP triphosphohydrolase